MAVQRDASRRVLTTTESFAREPVETDAAGMRKLLNASLVSWLADLKAAAESLG